MWGRVGEKEPSPQAIRQAKQEREYLELVLDTVNSSPGIDELIVGDAKGVDEFTKRWAINRKVPFAKNVDNKREPFPADWDQFGKSAGVRRNIDMLVKGEPDAAIAFHRDFMRSKGTKDMVTRLLDAGIMVSIHPSVSKA